MFDESYRLVAEGKIDEAIDAIMENFDIAYGNGAFIETANALLTVDFSKLNETTLVTVATVSWWGRKKTGCHATVIANIEKKLRETLPSKRVKKCLDGLRT